jgi:drug/metabolite transporter (DMT)-like permease
MSVPASIFTRSVSQRAAFGLLVFAAVLWSLGGLLIKSIHWSPLGIAGVRSAIASAFILVALRRPRFSWSAAQIGAAAACAATMMLFVIATRLTTAANAILLQYTAPVWVALFAHWVLGERTRWIDWATITVAFGGMALFFVDQLSHEGVVGNLLAIASGLSFAWLAMLMRKQKDGSTVESVLLGNALAAALCLPFCFTAPPTALSDWGALLVLGLFQIGLSYVCFSIAIRVVPAIEGILVPIVEPILNPVWVFLFLGEKPGGWAVVGGAIVLAAVATRGLAVTQSPQRGVEK